MIVYLIRNKINNKCYIGKTKNSLVKRFQEHCNSANKGESNQLIHKALRKYGINNFTRRKLVNASDHKELNKLEIHLIKYHHSHVSEGGYNLTFGGDGGPTRNGMKHSKETIRKMSISQKHSYQVEGRKGYWIGKCFSEESKQKISKRLKGNKNSLGSKHSEETKQNVSKRMKGNKHGLGYKHTEEFKTYLSEKMKGWKGSRGFKGKHHTEETKLKLSITNQGKTLSKETKRKISESMKKYQNENKYKTS